jgi:PAS domain S-box-containing protein
MAQAIQIIAWPYHGPPRSRRRCRTLAAFSRIPMKSRTQTKPPAVAGSPAVAIASDADALLAQAPVALCVVDHALRIGAVNAEMERLLGAGDVAGQRLGDVSPRLLAQIAAPLEQAIRTGQSTTGLRIRMGEAGAWVFSARRLAGGDGGSAAVVIAAQPLAPEPAPDEEAPALLAAIVESSGDAIISKTLDGVITFWNAAAERLFGYTAQEAVGRHITILIPGARHEEERLIRQRLSRGETVEHFETVRRTRDGRLLDVSITTSPVRDRAGKIIGASNTTRDITDQKRARQALRESEKRFRALADAAPVLIWMSGRRKEGVYFNRPWLEFTGLPLEVQLGAGWTRCVHPDDAERLAAICADAFERRESFTADFRLRRADGEYRWLRENGVPRLAASGELLGYIGACVDITETRHAAEELEHSRRALQERATELQTLLDVLPVGVYIAQDPQCQSIIANAAGQRMLRLPAPDSNASKTGPAADGLSFRVLRDGDEVSGDDLPMQRCCRTGEAVTGETYDIVFDDGSIAQFYELVSPLRSADGAVRGAVAAFVDITERKRAEETLRQRARQQAAVAKLGLIALAEDDLDRLFDQAVSMVAETLDVAFCKLLELLPDGRELLLRAGVGWNDGTVGSVRVGAGRASQAGFTLESEGPVIVEDLRTETRFDAPPLLHDHAIVSGASCVIYTGEESAGPALEAGAARRSGRQSRPWGVLGADSRARRTFTADDVNFLQSMANVLGGAIRQRRAEETLRQRARQQAAVARLGQIALAENDLDRLLNQAVTMVAETLEVELCKALELLPGGSEVLLRAGVGWKPGLVGRGRVSTGLESQAGYTLASDQPVTVEDLRTETRFSGPPLLHDHGVVSGISCVIHAGEEPGAPAPGRAAPDSGRDGRPWGVLGAHTRTRRAFTADDVNFLQAVANVLGSAIRQRRAELALQESQGHLSLAMIAGRMGAWDYEVASGRVTWSSTLEQIHGIPIGSFGGAFDDYQSDMHPEDRQRVLATIDRALSRREEYHAEYRIIRPDGATVWLEARGHVIVNEHGEPERLVGICADVTDRKQADRALRESEERFRTLANSAPVLIWVNDPDGTIFVNQSYLDFLGVQRSAVLGFGWAGHVHPDDREDYLKAYHDATERQAPFEARFRFRRHDGQYRWMKSVGVPRMSGDRLAGYVGSTVDITDVLEAEHALRQSFDRLRVIYTLSDAVARAESPGEINRLAVDGVIEALGVDRASLLLFDESGVMRFRAWRGLSDAYRAAVEGHSPWTPEDVDPEPVMIPDISGAEGLGALRERILAEGVGALAFIPLTSPGRLLGKLMLYSNRPRRFAPEELRLAQTIAGHVALAIDRGQAAEALRESEERFRALADNIAQLAWMADASGSAVWYNQRWFDYTGMTQERALADGWREAHHPDHLDRVAAGYLQHVQAGEAWEDTFPLRGADGHYRWFLSRAVPIRDANGEVVRWFGTNTDITDVREAHEERMKYVALVENALDFVGLASPDGRILYLNPAARRLLRVDPGEDVTAATIHDFIPTELQSMYREEAIPQTLENGFWEGEVRFCRRSGEEVPMYQTSFLIRYPADSDDVSLATVAQNITARKRHEEQMRLVMGELNHRVKNTLAVVESMARQTLRSSARPEDFIAAFGDRLRGLARVHGMLTQAQWEGVGLRELVAAELAPRVASPTQAVVDGPPVTLPPGAALTMHMTLHELATNAAKHGALSVPEGSVRVRWRHEGEGDRRRLVLEWQERGGPRVAPPMNTGFGTRVLNQLIEYELKGRCTVSFDPEGVRCEIETPWTALCQREGELA